MTHQTLVKILTDYLKEKQRVNDGWVHGGTLEEVARNYPIRSYEGETAKRRLREMTQTTHRNYNPNIEENYKNGCVVYRFTGLEEKKPISKEMTSEEILRFSAS